MSKPHFRKPAFVSSLAVGCIPTIVILLAAAPRSIESWGGLQLAYAMCFASGAALVFSIVGGICYAGINAGESRDQPNGRRNESRFADFFVSSVLLVVANTIAIAATLGILRLFY